MSLTAVLAAIGALLGSAGLGGWLKAWLDHKLGKRKQTDEVALKLVETLESRVSTLEGNLEKERIRCEAEHRILRHRIGNQRMLIYSLLHLFDVPASKRKEMLASIRDELASLENAEAVEKGFAAAHGLKEDPE